MGSLAELLHAERRRSRMQQQGDRGAEDALR